MVEPPKRLMTKLCTSSARIHMSDSALESPWWVDAILALFSWIPVIMRGVGGRGGGCGSDVTSSSQKGRCTWFSFFMDNLLFFPAKTRTIVRRKAHYSYSSFQPPFVGKKKWRKVQEILILWSAEAKCGEMRRNNKKRSCEMIFLFMDWQLRLQCACLWVPLNPSLKVPNTKRSIGISICRGEVRKWRHYRVPERSVHLISLKPQTHP